MERLVPPRRRHDSIRMKGFDYSSKGAYAITICTKKRIRYLADPLCRGMVEDAWKYIPVSFPTVALDIMAIMPDHMHGILWLNPTEQERPKLGDILRKFKGDVTRTWLQHCGKSENSANIEHFTIWQNRFHDHIIRKSDELDIWRRYIRDNPEKHRHKDQGYL